MHLERRVLATDEDLDPARAGDAADQLAEVGPVLEGGEDPPELVALGELGRLHDVEQAVAEDLLDRRPRRTRGGSGRSARRPAARGLRRGPRRRARPSRLSARVAVMSIRRSLRSAATALSVGWSIGSSSSRVTRACLIAPSRRTRIRLAIRSLTADEVDPPDMGGARLGRRGEPGRARHPASVVAARRNQCSLANSTWPNWWRIISCSTGGQRHRVDDRLDVEAIAGVRRHAAGARVRVGQQAGRLELGEDAPDRRAGHAKAVALDERLAADRRGGRDVFLDDGPKDRLRAEVQGAEGATIPTRQTVLPRWLALDR